MRSAFGEFQSGACHEIGYDSRYQNFARAGLRHHPRGRVNRYAADITTPDLDFTSVKTCAQRQTDLQGGGAERQGTSHCASGSIECRQNAVAGILDQDSTVLLDHPLRELIVTVQQPAPTLIAHFRGAARRITMSV